PRSATVSIYDELPNQTPKVTITSPKNGAEFESGTPILLTAEANDPDGEIRALTFFANEQLIGSLIDAPYTLHWNDVAPGTYVLVAKASDDKVETGVSSSIRIRVTQRV